MTRAGTWVRVGCLLGALLGGFLVVTGALRFFDDRAGAGGPAARLLFGALILLGAVGVAVVASRGRPSGARSWSTTASRTEEHAETTICPSCGETNPPSSQHCHHCDEPLR